MGIEYEGFRKIVSYTIISLLLTGQSFGQNNLASNKTFRKSFTEKEIQDLQLVFNFFNENICDNKNLQNPEECFRMFFKRMEEAASLDEIEINIPFDKQMNMYGLLEDATFFQVWSFGWSLDPRNAPLDTFAIMHFANKGKYMKFLKRTGRTDKVIKNYYQTTIAVGDITPTLVGGLLYYHNYYNTADIRVRFIIAIHYLTLNDQFERKEKYNARGVKNSF